jgi:excisionase family DNA binding protein
MTRHYAHDGPPASEFLRPHTVAPDLNVTVSRIYQLIASGVIPSVRIGRSILIPRRAWEAWVQHQADEAQQSLAANQMVHGDDGDAFTR